MHDDEQEEQRGEKVHPALALSGTNGVPPISARSFPFSLAFLSARAIKAFVYG